MRALFMLCLLVGPLGACVVDDSIIEDKHCSPLRTDECINGYSCDCQNGECRCRKNSAQPFSEGDYPLSEPGQDSVSASLRLLQRQGAVPSQPSR